MNFDNIFHRAREVVLASDLHSLPINPIHVCAKLNIPVVSFTEARTNGFNGIIGKINYEDVDGFCYKSAGNRYIIFYDDMRAPKERINFTIAHELGHIVLGHLENESILPRYMTNRKSDPREKDADVFAGELIRPPIPFVLAGCERADDIQNVCNITYEAATVCARLAQTLRGRRTFQRYSKDFQFYHDQFFDFLYSKYCGRCRHSFISAVAKFCPMCGNKHLHWFNPRLPLLVMMSAVGGDLVVKYKEYPVNEQNQIICCIRCGNDAILAGDSYCKICGAPVRNYCAGRYVEVGQGDYRLISEQSCGAADLPSNARYCTSCGGVSAFSHAGLLPPWDDENSPEFDFLE